MEVENNREVVKMRRFGNNDCLEKFNTRRLMSSFLKAAGKIKHGLFTFDC